MFSNYQIKNRVWKDLLNIFKPSALFPCWPIICVTFCHHWLINFLGFLYPSKHLHQSRFIGRHLRRQRMRTVYLHISCKGDGYLSLEFADTICHGNRSLKHLDTWYAVKKKRATKACAQKSFDFWCGLGPKQRYDTTYCCGWFSSIN